MFIVKQTTKYNNGQVSISYLLKKRVFTEFTLQKSDAKVFADKKSALAALQFLQRDAGQCRSYEIEELGRS